MSGNHTSRSDHLNALIDELSEEAEGLTEVSNWIVADMAERTGYSTRHVRRRIKERRSGKHVTRSPWEPDRRHLEAIFATCGNVVRAFRLCEREGLDVPSQRTFQRAINRTLGSTGIAAAKHGTPGIRNKQIYLTQPDRPRNDTWEMDHVEVPVHVIPTDTKTPVKPYLTVAIEFQTRMIMGYAVTWGRATAESVRAAITTGVHGWWTPDDNFVGGPRS